MTERYSGNQRRKTPSFSSSLLDSILRSIDETNDERGLHDDSLSHLQQQVHTRNRNRDHDYDHIASERKRSTKIHLQQTHLMNQEEQSSSLRRAIMIDQWMDARNNNNNNHNRKSKFSSDSSSSGTMTFTASSASSETETPVTYRSLPNSFTISRKTAEAIFLDDTQKASSNKVEGKFMKSTKLRAIMKIYGDLKKVKQPISPGSRISTFIYSLFGSSSSSSSSSSSKKVKIEESFQNFRSLKKSRSIKQDATMNCTSFSRSCMSKKQHSSSVKRSVRFYPVTDTIILHERDSNSMPLPNHERRRFADKNYNNFMVNVEDDEEDEDEDDLFELEIGGGVRTGGYGQELPVFETTDLRKIRI